MAECRMCGEAFEPRRSRQVFCCGECKVRWWSLAENTREFQLNHKKAHPEKRLHKAAKERAKATGQFFDIEVSDVVIPDRCPILGCEFESNLGKGQGANPRAPSLDKIIPDLGYTKGNIQVVSFKANSMKRDGTIEELLNFAEWVFKTYKEGE